MILIMAPAAIAAVVASRGSGASNLKTPSPKEVWADSATGSATLTIDLGAARSIDTIMLGHVRNASVASTWSLRGGLGSSAEFVIQDAMTLRVPDVAGRFDAVSHALWRGSAVTARHLSITITQPSGAPILAGTVLAGQAFVPRFDKEWGSGRRPIDTGAKTPLSDGGFAIVEGARKRQYSWTLGDLTVEETDALEEVALECGETRPALVIEDAARSAGLRARIHYGLFEAWRAFERRNRQQTRWEIGIQEWT